MAARLRLLRDHLPDAQPAAQAAHAEAADRTPPLPLTPAQIADFHGQGYLVLPMPELSAEWRSSFYESMNAERKRAAALDRESGWPADVAHRSPNFAKPAEVCSSEIRELMATPTFRGALSSLLGEDFFIPRNCSLHVSSELKEQTFHKDGTDHGPTQHTHRDARPTRIVAMFFPIDVTLEMGPTAVIGHSHWLGTDREGFFNSEDRYVLSHRPAAHSDAGGGFESWAEAEAQLIAGEKSTDAVAVRDARRMAEASELLGTEPSELEQRRLLVPGGSLLIQHHDLVHRGTMRGPESDEQPWRPMIAFRGAIRVSEGDSAPNDQALATAIAALPPPGPLPLDEASLAELVRSSKREPTRIAAAFALGKAAAAGSDPALGRLAALLTHEEERCRRAATQGLTAAAASAVPLLLDIIQQPQGRVPPSPQPNVDRESALVVSAVHLLAHAGAAALTHTAVTTLANAVERAMTELEEAAAARDAAQEEADAALLGNLWPPTLLDFRVVERRRVLAECATTLGRLGNRALQAGEEDLLLSIVEVLLPLATAETEPGARFPSFMSAVFVRGNACVGLLRLCSSSERCAPSVPKDHAPPNDAQFAWDEPGLPLSALIGEALRRLEQPAQGGKQEAARRAVAARLGGVAWPWPLGEQQFVEL